MPIKSSRWYIEAFGPAEAHVHGIRQILFSKQTAFQAVDIYDLESYGKALILDSKIQSSALDEFIYHEILVHPALLIHPNPRRIFIVGGGEGATIRELLRHRTVERVVMVDIDQEVVEGCRQHLPEWHQGCFDDPRVEVLHLDARKYLEERDETFDVIIVDISEPIVEGPAYLLFTKEFYEVARHRLSPEGTIALQAGTVSLVDLTCFAAIHKTLQAVFPVVAPCWAAIPSFTVPWGFSVATKGPDPRAFAPATIDRLAAERIKGALRYYDGETHQMSFLLPKHIRTRLAEERRLIEDNHPLYIYH